MLKMAAQQQQSSSSSVSKQKKHYYLPKPTTSGKIKFMPVARESRLAACLPRVD
jgi:hypothetical protein